LAVYISVSMMHGHTSIKFNMSSSEHFTATTFVYVTQKLLKQYRKK